MASGLDTFGKIARDLARNPLGIIALFIVLIYGFAALLLSKIASVLTPGQGYVLIIFLAVFPVIVLGIFAWLVSQHHAKLYAPADFKSDKAFLQTLSADERLEHLAREIEIEQIEPSEKTISQLQLKEREERYPKISSADMMNKFRQAENLVFQKLEAEIEQSIQREVRILGTGDLGIFDGAIEDKNQIMLIEVKYLHSPFFPLYMIRDVLYRAALAKQKAKEIGRPSDIRVLFIIVTELRADDLKKIQKRIDPLLKDSLVPVELRYYDLEQLKVNTKKG